MVLHSTITEEEVPPSAPDLSSLSPLPSLEAAGSSSSDDMSPAEQQDGNDILSSPSNPASSTIDAPNNNSEPHRNKEHGDVKAATKFRLDSMLSGYSFIWRLSIVLVVILSWYYAYPTTGNSEQQDEMLEYEEEYEDEEEEYDPWSIWGDGFDYTKDREFWIPDEDLPEDIATDLQSTNEELQLEATARRQLDPLKWDTFDYWEIYHYFACAKVFTSPRPVWSEQLFRDTRDFYHEIVENDNTPFIGLFRSTYQANDDVYDMSQNAIPYLSGGEKGRGLKAARDIKEGEVIFKATNNTIIFNDGQTLRKFLFAMNDRFSDPGMVCDILIWAWVQDMEGGTPFAGVVDLDNGNLLNDWGLGGSYEEQDYSANIRCKGAALSCYASKDIIEGEELLGDYSDFVSYHAWADLGL
mmetsp:Transcript_7267/g.12276  ORF Transcript_7267/g.12276 Transcript_7267/m.12276 type:complete len:411 (-) Transcript_7267:38-1270(-)